MPGRVELYYDYSSPWTYLAFTRIEELCRRCGAELVWRPILVGGIFNTVSAFGTLFINGEVQLHGGAGSSGAALNFPEVGEHILEGSGRVLLGLFKVFGLSA